MTLSRRFLALAAALLLALPGRSGAQTPAEVEPSLPATNPADSAETDELASDSSELEKERFDLLGSPSQQWSAVTVVHGLPSDTVRAIAQDRDGILWIGTDRGLVRYDGRRIERTGRELPLPEVRSLAFDRNGVLWAGTGSGAFVNSGETWTPVPGTAGHPIEAIHASKEGPVVLGSRNGTVFQCDPSRSLTDPAAVIRTAPEDAPILQGPSGPVPVVAITPADSGWGLGSGGRGLLLYHDRQVTQVAPGGPFFVNSLVRLGGQFFAGVDTGPSGRGIYKLEESGLRPLPHRTGPVSVLSDDASGGLWAGTRGNGLFHLLSDGTVEQLSFGSTRGGLRSDRVLSLVVDRDGVVWVGTDRGLCRYDPGAPRPVRLGTSPKSNFVHCLLRDSQGVVWAGTHSGLFFRLREGDEWRSVERFAGSVVYSLFEPSAGRILAGTASSLEILDPSSGWRASRSWRVIPPRGEGARRGSIRGIQQLGGTIYVARFGSGIERLGSDGLEPVWPREEDPEALRQVVSLSLVGDELWIGTASAGAFVLRGSEVRPLELLGPSALLWSAASGKSGSVWAGTGSGLLHIAEKRVVQVTRGYEVRRVVSAPGEASGVWAATVGSGLLRVEPREGGGYLTSRLGMDHGLPSDSIYALESSIPGQGGMLLIGTNRGLASCAPARRPPGLRIVRVLSRRPHPPEEWNALRLEHPQNSLLLEVSAIAGRTYPQDYQYLFTLKMPGGGSRSVLQSEPQFVAESLEPGKYQLSARAFGTDLLPSPDAALEFEIGGPPVPWVSIGLAVLLAFASTALLWVYVLYRRLRKANQALAETRLQLVHETESERRRIARDLHDQTLADLRRLLLQGGEKDPRGFSEAVEAISTEIRRICEDLSPSVLENVGLRAALEWALEAAVSQAPAGRACQKRFVCPEDLDDRLDLDGTVEIQIYRIVQEALANAVRHSGATQFTLEAEIGTDGGLEIMVTDNGHGFDARKTPAGRGLSNIRSRASLIAAEVNWSQAEGGGTVFRLERAR